jgi:hypothetical protein
MKQIFAPFQKLECFEVDGVQYLVLDYQIIQDSEDKLVEWCSWYKFKRLKDHKHFLTPFTKVYDAHKNGSARLCRC